MLSVQTILTSLVCCVFTFLVTYFMTNLANRNREEAYKEKISSMIKGEIKEAMRTHEAIKHQEIVRVFVEESIKEHQRNCVACNSIDSIKAGIAHLILKNGDNPQKVMG